MMATPISYRWELCGQRMHQSDGGRVVSLSGQGDDFALALPVLKGPSLSTSCTFRLDFQPEPGFDVAVGVFPADLSLSSRPHSSSGKRVALRLGGGNGGAARVVGNGSEDNKIEGVGWAPGDKIKVAVAFESETACRVTFTFKTHTASRLLEGVPTAGLCFGVGMHGRGRQLGVALLDEPPVAAAAGAPAEAADVARAAASVDLHAELAGLVEDVEDPVRSPPPPRHAAYPTHSLTSPRLAPAAARRRRAARCRRARVRRPLASRVAARPLRSRPAPPRRLPEGAPAAPPAPCPSRHTPLLPPLYGCFVRRRSRPRCSSARAPSSTSLAAAAAVRRVRWTC